MIVLCTPQIYILASWLNVKSVFVFQHYERDANGLCTQLRKPVAKQGNFEFCVNKEEFVRQGWVIKKKELRLQEVIGGGDFGGKS